MPRPLPPIPSLAAWAILMLQLRVEATTHCWVWQGATGKRQRSGRDGRVRAIDVPGSPLVSPHRITLTWAQGAPPDAARVVACHLCANPLCCNPVHLYWGTASENEQDKRRRQPDADDCPC